MRKEYGSWFKLVVANGDLDEAEVQVAVTLRVVTKTPEFARLCRPGALRRPVA